MTDIFIPPWLNIATVAYSPVEQVGLSQSPFGGFPRTATLAGGRMRASMEFTAVGASQTQSERGALMAFLARAGRANRVIFGNPAFRLRGSFPASELLSNNTFASGTTGYTEASSTCVLTATERVLRATRTASTANTKAQGTGTTVAYTPYAARVMTLAGRGSPVLQVAAGDGTVSAQSATGAGMSTCAIVPVTTSVAVAAVDSATGQAGDYFEVPYISLSQCALVDAGANLLVRSDEFDNASWAKTECTVTANAVTAPDGAATGDSLVDNGNNTNHFLGQGATISSSTSDYTVSVAIKAGSRNFAVVEMATATGTASAYWNLTTGAVSNVGAGVSFSNARAANARDLGNGWWRCSVTARKTTSETVLTARVYSANVAGSVTYAGSTNAAVHIWRGTASASSVAARLVQTTTALTSGESQLANGLHLKGLPASTIGLLLPGDAVEVITSASRGGEYKIVTAPLNSDASGLGYLQFAPALRFSPSDNSAVVIHQPMGRFISLSDAESWNTDPGIITTASAEFIEA